MLKRLFLLAAVSVACMAQDYEDYQQPSIRQSSGANRYVQQEEPKQEPIAILKQINKHNEDGSYTYGYEGADGSFKIETKAADGEVRGKYGYTDADGKVKVVEYGANKYGFQPSGEGITVPPVNYNEVKDVDYEEVQQFAPQPKAPKAQRPQSFNYAPAAVEKRKPVFVSTPAPAQYYDYEEEVPAATPRPIQLARPKYAVPAQQPQQTQQPQFSNDFEFAFGPLQKQQQPAKPETQQQYQQFANRQPVQFPAETESPIPSNDNRNDQFQLFSPQSRADTHKPRLQQFAQEPFQYSPQPQQSAVQRPSFASKPAQARTTSVLDQLAKDPQYTLPQSSPALHDISFGYSL